MDSVTMLHDYRDEIALAVTFDYGSNHAQREIEMARLNCNILGIEHLVIPLDFMHDYFKSSLLEGAEAIPEGHYAAENMKSTVVPFRNGIMLAIATGLAESRVLRRVLIANHSADHTIYPDCRPDFIQAMNEAMHAGTYEGCFLYAPYTNMTKTDIAKRGAALGVDYALTYSCYKGGEKHCGKCGTCVERKEALRDAGIKDPTGGDISYVSWAQASEALRYQVATLLNLFWTQGQMPDISFDQMKGLGNIGYDARQTMFMDAHLKIDDESGPWIEALERECNVIKAFLKQMNTAWASEVDNVDVEHIITPYVQNDEAAEIDKWVKANGGKPVVSQLESIQNLGISADPVKTMEMINEEAAKAALAQMQSVMGGYQ